METTRDTIVTMLTGFIRGRIALSVTILRYTPIEKTGITMKLTLEKGWRKNNMTMADDLGPVRALDVALLNGKVYFKMSPGHNSKEVLRRYLAEIAEQDRDLSEVNSNTHKVVDTIENRRVLVELFSNMRHALEVAESQTTFL